MQIKVDENDICNKEYIYLDWNVIKYMKEPRENNYLFDMEFREVIKRSRTRYVYPFCEAHFMDRAHNFKEEYRELVENIVLSSFSMKLENGKNTVFQIYLDKQCSFCFRQVA